MKRKTFILLLSLLFILVIAAPALAEVDPKVAANAKHFAWWTLLPPVVAIGLAFITKNVVLSLFLGIWSGTVLLQTQNNNILVALGKGLLDVVTRGLNALADPWNAGVVLQCLAIGGLIALITKMGGAKAIAVSLSKMAKTARSSQIVTWLLGILVFFDDYANSLIVGPIMRPVTDALRVSREKLAFIIDATAAPVAGIALISTWVGYEVGLIKDAYGIIGVNTNAYSVFVQSIPYRFYNILILFFIVVIALAGRDFGPMLKAERRARFTGKVLEDTARPMVSAETSSMEPAPNARLNIWNGIIPILTLIFGALIGFYVNGYNAIMGGSDKALQQLIAQHPMSFTSIRECFGSADASIVLFQAAILACIVAMIMGVAQKIFSWQEAIDTWIQGIKSLVITGVILLLAWSISGVMKELGTAHFLVSIVSGALPAFILPTIIFLIACVISFATGTSFGTMGILMPLTVPLAAAINPAPDYIILAVAGVLAGAIFGDHCSPISDTTILSSMGSACDHLDHVRTQMPYSITIAIVSVIAGLLPAGFGLPAGLCLLISAAVVLAVVFIIGKPIEAAEYVDEAVTQVAVTKE